MTVGRFQFGKVIIYDGSLKQLWFGEHSWSFMAPMCGCKLLTAGPIYFTWINKDCKCITCDRYECVCSKDEE